MNAPKIMLPKSSVIFAVFVFLLHIYASAERQGLENLKPQLAQAYGKIPLHFEANCGQADLQVKFLARGRGYGLFLTATEAVIELRNPGLSSSENRHPKAQTRDSRLETVLRMKLVGASSAARLEGIDLLPGRSNYFIGNDSRKWHIDIPTYARVRYSQIYPGIDLVYYGNQNQLEYDFVIRPGSDPGRIALDVQGADQVEVGPQGDLLLRAAGAVMSQRKPTVYQEIDGIRREVSGSYVVEGKHRLRFRVADYDSSKPLVIDPTIDYSTYLGGSGRDQGFAITVDADGNAYVTGETISLNFPITPGSVQTTFGSGFSADVFVAKLNPAGSSLLYSTYLGGGGRDQGFGIAVDADGNAYVAGLTLSTNFPTTPGALKTTLGGMEDAFVAKLNSTGSALVYSTLLGGGSTDFALGIALDAAGNAYVTGGTTSVDFPTSAGALQTSLGGNTDAFVTKLNPSGSSILYSTYVGGSSFDQGLGIKVDAAGSAYITGETTSANFPISPGAAQTVFGGVRDAFVVKLNPTASAIVYSTYLGGSNFDRGLGIAVDAVGSVYVTGETTSTNFPTTPGAHQTVSGGGDDAFVAKLKSDGSGLAYSTYLGGTSFDFGEGIAVDAAGIAYVTGGTKSPNFPTTADAQQPALAGSDDVFITQLDAAGSLIYSTYVGGTSSDEGFSIAIDSTGAAYVTGETASANFPTTSGVVQSAFGGVTDAFVVKIAGAALPPTITCPANITTSTAPGECSRVVDFSTPSGSTGSTVTCSPSSGSVFQKGATTVTCTATDSAGVTASCSFTVTVNDNEAPAISCPANVTMAATSPAGVMVSYPAPSVSDNCPGATVSATPASGSIFSVGVTPVIATATDASGNTSTCTFTVTVSAPLVIVCPAPIVKSTDPGKCSAVVDYPAAATSGGVGAVSVSYSQPSGSAFLKGTTTVTATATDSAGDTATCSFTVTIMDTEPPTIVCPANITTSTDPGQPTAKVTFPAPTAADNCSDVTVDFNPPSGSIFPQGTTTVIATATDASGNTASCSFTVTVHDNEPPTIACPPDMTAFQDSAFGATVNYPSPEATDNSPGVMVACTPPSGSVLHLGSTTVTCTATDTSGNTAACTFTVTVIPPPSTPGAKVTGGGSIQAAEVEASFALDAMVKSSQPSGSLIYQDHVRGLTVTSTSITAVQVTETHARIFGKAKINQLGSFDFVVDVDDLAEPGKGSDTFHIQLSNGYSAGGILAGGNVQIH
ncbi:MAG TPA: HYR domain-containing protein [Acidobacteriota bacterium]